MNVSLLLPTNLLTFMLLPKHKGIRVCFCYIFYEFLDLFKKTGLFDKVSFFFFFFNYSEPFLIQIYFEE